MFVGRTVHVERSGREDRTTTLQKQMDDASRDDRGKYLSDYRTDLKLHKTK